MSRLLIAAALCLLPLTVAADVVYMTDGRQIEGKIVEQDAEQIVLLVERPGISSKMTIPRRDVLRIDKGKTRFERLREKYVAQRAVARRAGSAASWETLAIWCRRAGMSSEASQAIDRALPLRERAANLSNTADDWHGLATWCRSWKRNRQAVKYDLRAINLDGQHAAARLALGHKQLDGRWMSPAQFRTAYANKMRLSGYVEYEGQWHSAAAATAIARLRDQRLSDENQALRNKMSVIERALSDRGAELAAVKAAYDKLRRQAAYDLGRLQSELDRERRRSRELLRALRLEQARRAAERRSVPPK